MVMKPMLIKVCMFLSVISTLNATVDYVNSIIVAPKVGSTVTTRTPLLCGVIVNENKKPVKNKMVTVYIDNRMVGRVSTNKHGVWAYRPKNNQQLTDGMHSIEACVLLATGKTEWTRGSFFNVVASDEVRLHRSGNVDAANSTINFPFDGGDINTDTPIVIVSLLDSGSSPVTGETVSISIDGLAVGVATSDSNGVASYQLSVPLSEASHTVGAHCVQSSVDLTTNAFVVDVTAPAVPSIVAPAENDVVATSTVTISGTTEAYATITTFVDGDTYGDISYADEYGAWSIDYDLANGAHTVTAQATDLANNSGAVSATRDFTVSA